MKPIPRDPGLFMTATVQVNVQEPPPCAQRLEKDPRIGYIHSFGYGGVRTMLFVPPEYQESAR